MNYIKLFEEYGQVIPLDFTNDDMDIILYNIRLVKNPKI